MSHGIEQKAPQSDMLCGDAALMRGNIQNGNTHECDRLNAVMRLRTAICL